jgi:hypothetical protein
VGLRIQGVRFYGLGVGLRARLYPGRGGWCWGPGFGRMMQGVGRTRAGEAGVGHVVALEEARRRDLALRHVLRRHARRLLVCGALERLSLYRQPPRQCPGPGRDSSRKNTHRKSSNKTLKFNLRVNNVRALLPTGRIAGTPPPTGLQQASRGLFEGEGGGEG